MSLWTVGGDEDKLPPEERAHKQMLRSQATVEITSKLGKLDSSSYATELRPMYEEMYAARHLGDV